MPLMYRISKELIGNIEGKSEIEVIDSLPIMCLTPNELKNRLLRRSRIIKRIFPISAFIIALGDQL